jgi:hypothetical protein
MMWTKDKLMFGVGMFGLLIALLNLYTLHTPYEGRFDRYFVLFLFLYAAVLFYRAARPGTGR